MEYGYVAILTADLRLAEGRSLKTKRRELVRVKNALVKGVSCSVAEVDHHDLWQRAQLSVCVVDRSAADATERIDHARRLLAFDEEFELVEEHWTLLGAREAIEQWGDDGER